MPATVISQAELAAIDLPTGPPGKNRLVGEIGVVVEPLRLALNSRRLLSAPRGAGRRTVLIPGWKTPEAAMFPIGAFLCQLGHKATGWGLGSNGNDVEERRDRFLVKVTTRFEKTGEPVNLVGWSLGGVIAREVARAAPEMVHRVVTYGTPVLGGPTHTVGAESIGQAECERITELQEHLDETDPIRVPITAIFTRRDGALDWRSCIDRSSLNVTMLEATSTHVGLGIDPDVWIAVARALAEKRPTTA